MVKTLCARVSNHRVRGGSLLGLSSSVAATGADCVTACSWKMSTIPAPLLIAILVLMQLIFSPLSSAATISAPSNNDIPPPLAPEAISNNDDNVNTRYRLNENDDKGVFRWGNVALTEQKQNARVTKRFLRIQSECMTDMDCPTGTCCIPTVGRNRVRECRRLRAMDELCHPHSKPTPFPGFRGFPLCPCTDRLECNKQSWKCEVLDI